MYKTIAYRLKIKSEAINYFKQNYNKSYHHPIRQTMVNQLKITYKTTWYVTINNRMSIVNATYRQALSFINHLNQYYHYEIKDLLIKPRIK